VTSVCFGGDAYDRLYVLTGTNDEHPNPAGGEVYVMPAPTRGLPSPLARVSCRSPREPSIQHSC
jgi:sugar lactone lactonase YvrE